MTKDRHLLEPDPEPETGPVDYENYHPCDDCAENYRRQSLFAMAATFVMVAALVSMFLVVWFR